MMLQEWVDPSTRGQITIMVITTAVEFACGFGLLVLVGFGLYDMVAGTLGAGQLMAYSVSFWLTLWTGYRAMQLVVRPTGPGLAVVLLSGLLALTPIVALQF